jgi:glutamyl-Q tRNA(Asp) synthetase
VKRDDPPEQYIGRFAPSPTGDLHFGSLVAALASYLQAKSSGGQWLVRIEDIDPPREVAGSAGRILDDLQRLGLLPDEPVLYQSTRLSAYREAVDRLLESGRAFVCGCSRADLPASGVYPGTCRYGLPDGKQARSVRLRVGSEPIVFEDRIQGRQEENLRDTVGDFVIWRADDLPAYQIAVVVDDAWQGISEIVRGADLLDSTTRQIWLQRCLGLPSPHYAHHPVARDGSGAKLSKRLNSDPVAVLPPSEVLTRALHFLGQPCPAGLSAGQVLDWGRKNWQLSKIRAASRYNAAPGAG